MTRALKVSLIRIKLSPSSSLANPPGGNRGRKTSRNSGGFGPRGGGGLLAARSQHIDFICFFSSDKSQDFAAVPNRTLSSAW